MGSYRRIHHSALLARAVFGVPSASLLSFAGPTPRAYRCVSVPPVGATRVFPDRELGDLSAVSKSGFRRSPLVGFPSWGVSAFRPAAWRSAFFVGPGRRAGVLNEGSSLCCFSARARGVFLRWVARVVLPFSIPFWIVAFLPRVPLVVTLVVPARLTESGSRLAPPAFSYVGELPIPPGGYEPAIYPRLSSRGLLLQFFSSLYPSSFFDTSSACCHSWDLIPKAGLPHLVPR